MPSVKDGESQKSFVSRCIPTVLKEGTAKNQKQAAAICFSMFKEHKKKKSKGENRVKDSLITEIKKWQPEKN